jgi:hypothetical protein
VCARARGGVRVVLCVCGGAGDSVHVRRTEGTSKVTYEDYQKASAGVQTLLQDTLASLQSAAASGVKRKGEAEAPPEVEKASIDDFYVDVTSLVAAQLERGLLVNDLDMPGTSTHHHPFIIDCQRKGHHFYEFVDSW